MPPKQKEVKKGPIYKNALLSKDLVPVDIKQAPRQMKSIKTPEVFPEPSKNDKKPSALFDSWPSQQAIKAFDFGIANENKFQDQSHQLIVKHLKNPSISSWKSIHELQKIKAQKPAHQTTESQKQVKSGINLQEIQQINQQPAKDPILIQTYERDETAEQIENRLKEQTQLAQKNAKDKKKGKKQEIKEEGPIKIKDVKMSDIKVEDYMTKEGIWIGSQLQMIKTRSIVDSYSRQPIWKKIYPQENGVPQITKSGKYWVKLYYMDQAVKIEVDDRIPLNESNRQMFALSQKKHQKWTLILTKAVIKYMLLINPKMQILGSDLVIHALTGMISQQTEVKIENIERFKYLLNDRHYLNKDVFISCYTDQIIVESFDNNKDKNANMRAVKLQNHWLEDQKELIEKQKTPHQLISEQPVRVMPGYSYLLGDYFTNEDFNMAFSKQRSIQEAKLRLEYSHLSKINLNNKTRDEKLDHRRRKKQIKEMLLVEEKKRLDFINEEKKQYHFIKLLNKSIQINCEFQEKQILLAKKCRLNGLAQPPNYQFPQNFVAEKDETKSMRSVSLIKGAKQQSEVNPDLDDFSAFQSVLDPLIRPEKGIWIKDVDFLHYFRKIQIIYNPNSFLNKSIQKVSGSLSEGVFVFDENKQILVLEKQQMGEDGVQIENLELLFGFSYEETRKSDSIQSSNATKPYCILQKFNFDQFSVVSNVAKLNHKIDSTLLNLKNQNHVFKIYTMCKSSYSYWVSSNAKFKLMSISEYLEEFQGYKKKVVSIEYPAIESKTYLPIARFNIKETSENINPLILKINSSNPQLIKNLRYNLVKAPLQSDKFFSNEVEGVILKSCEEKHLAIDYTRLQIQPNQQYELVLQSFPLENLQDGTCQITALIKSQSLIFDNAELIEPLRFIEKYKPNKYGLIFRERIFSNTLTKQGFLIKLVQGEEVQGGGNAGDKKAVKKSGKQESSAQFIEKPFNQRRTILVKVIKNQQIIYETMGTNWSCISSIRINNLKQKPTDSYFLQAHFDLREWPQACVENQDTAKICWTISVFGTDSIALVRDTKQEEKQKQTRKSWEDQQPNRTERAKKSRKRFLLLQKKQNGEQLTEEEEQIISAPRLTKKQQLEQQKKNEDKNKKGSKKDEKKGAKQVKNQQLQQKPPQIIFPKSIQNCNYEIKNFLKTLENHCFKKLVKPEDQEPRIRSDEEIRAIKESEKMTDENRINKMLRNVQRRQTIKLKQRDKKDQLLLQLEELNRQFKQAWTKYVSWRNQDLQKDKAKQEKQRAITEILKQQKPTVSESDLDKILNQYQQIAGFNQKLYDVGIMLKKNIKIMALSDKISGHLAGWEVQELKIIKEQINNQKIQGIQQAITDQMKKMLEEAEKNPAIVTEKQNQAKKAKKGGKK